MKTNVCLLVLYDIYTKFLLLFFYIYDVLDKKSVRFIHKIVNVHDGDFMSSRKRNVIFLRVGARALSLGQMAFTKQIGDHLKHYYINYLNYLHPESF